jgi:hypothetical protein
MGQRWRSFPLVGSIAGISLLYLCAESRYGAQIHRSLQVITQEMGSYLVEYGGNGELFDYIYARRAILLSSLESLEPSCQNLFEKIQFVLKNLKVGFVIVHSGLVFIVGHIFKHTPSSSDIAFAYALLFLQHISMFDRIQNFHISDREGSTLVHPYSLQTDSLPSPSISRSRCVHVTPGSTASVTS